MKSLLEKANKNGFYECSLTSKKTVLFDPLKKV